MLKNFILTFFVLLGIAWPTSFVSAQQVDCSQLDPRASVSKEREGKVKAAVNTLFKIVRVGGSVEGKMSDEIQNLQKGVPITEQGQIKLRTLYLFCGMVANATDISTDRKVELFNLMMEEKKTDKPEARRTAKKKKQKVLPKSNPPAAQPINEQKVPAPQINIQQNPQTNITVASQGQSGGTTAYQVIQTPGFEFDASNPLTVSPSIRKIAPGMNPVLILTITNHIDTPLFQIALRTRIDEGDLSIDDIKIEPQEKSKVELETGGIVVSGDIFSIGLCDSGGKLREKISYIYKIGSRSDKEFKVNINGNNLKKTSIVSFEIVGHAKEPAEMTTFKSPKKGESSSMSFKTPDWKQDIPSCNEKDNFDLAYDKGKKLLNKGICGEAINCFKRAVTLNPNIGKAHVNLGTAYHCIREIDSAIAEWEKAIQLDPNIPQAQFNLGISLMNNNKCNEAIVRFENASKLDHLLIKLDSFVAWGVCLKRLKQQEKAFEKYQLAINLNAKYGRAYFQWGIDLLEQGQYDQAINKFKLASELNDEPIRLDSLGFWGTALEKMDKNNEAIAKYKEVIDLAPNSQQANKSRNSIRKLTEKIKKN